MEQLEDRLLLTHSSGSPFLDSAGNLIAELGDTDDTLLLDPLGAVSVRLTINGDVHDYDRTAVRSFSVSAAGGNDHIEVSWALDIPAVLVGGAGSDTLLGGAAGDVLDGGADADSLV